jgi:PAS domain S-box-containing protein
MAVLWAANLSGSYESPSLLIALNLVFSALGSGFVAYLIGRSFLIRGAPGLLMLGCGVIAWGTAGLIGVVTGLVGLTVGHFDINVFVTIHNICVWLSALCHLAGAVLSLRPRRAMRETSVWLAAAYTVALASVGLVTLATLAGWTPTFFVQSQGGTPLRYVVLASATAMFAVTAVLLKSVSRRPMSAFVYWYTLTLGLIAVGLFGIMVEPVHAGPLSWTGRAAQFLGGAYMLFAAIASVRESSAWRIPLEVSLWESEQRHRNLFNNMTEGFALHEIVCDGQNRPCDYRFLDINPAFERLTGLRREDVVGNLVSAVLPDNDPYWVETYGEVALTGKPVHFENYSSPLKRRYEVYAYRPAPGQFAVMFVDTTDRKLAEEALRESEDQSRLLFEAANDGIVLHQLHTDRELSRFTRFNTVACRMLGYTPEEMPRLSPLDIQESPDLEQVPTEAERMRSDGRLLFEKVLVGKDGLRVPAEIHSTVFEHRGQTMVLSIIRDITERKRAELALRGSEERLRLAQQAAQIGTFEWDIQRNVMVWTPELEALYGLSPGSFGGTYEAWATLVHPDDRSQAGLPVEGPLVSDVAEAEWRVVRPDGSIRWLAGRGQIFRNPAGQPVRMVGVNLDITDRKAAEEALRQSESRYRHLMQSIPVPLGVVNRNGEIIHFNDCFTQVFGYTEADIPTLDDWWRHAYPDSAYRRRVMKNWHGKMQRSEETQTETEPEELNVTCKDGEVRVVVISNLVIEDCILAAFVDITERKRAEEALRESETLLRAVLDQMPSGVTVRDARTGKLIMSNAHAQQLMGPLVESIHEYSAYEAFHPDGRLLAKEDWPLARSAATGEVVNGEDIAYQRPGGSRITLRTSSAPMRDREGQIVAAVAVFDDITDRKRLEAHQALLADVLLLFNRGGELRPLVDEMLRLIRATTGFDAVGLRLRDGDDCPYFAQEGFAEEFLREENLLCLRNSDGTVRRDAEGLAVLQCTCGLVLSAKTDPSLPCFTARGSSWTNASHEYLSLPPEIDLRTNPRNRCIHCGYESVGLFPVRAGKAIIGLLQLNDRRPGRFSSELIAFYETLAQNIGLAIQRVTTEEALRHAKTAAEAANVAKSQFLANMSHELRTPMNAILGMIDVALPKATDPTVQDCLQTVKGSADLLLALLNDLLDSARIESGKLELESAPFSLRRMLDQITRVLAVRASENGLCFYCRMPQEMPDAVVGDRMRLQQVLLNLAGNAIKFTEHGEVEVGVRTLSQDGEGWLEFAVRDTGIGIPPSARERLFQSFAQADASMARRFGGTGLGLSICKSLVELMGGRIWVESEVDKGSTFYFTVPLPLAKDLPSEFEAPVAVPTVASAQLHILLVEDNPANQKLATYVLQDRGHVVEIAGDGQEAIRLTAQNRYDVILMDVQMPGMNGMEATAAIRKREDGTSRVPIIAMTAHAMRGDRDRCLAAGMDGYLSKPVNAQEMLGLVESLACGVTPMTQVVAAKGGPPETSPQATALVFDPPEALARCFNSKDMVREMIQCFFDEVNNLFSQMRVALEKGDLEEVGRLGHRMKGTVVYLGAQPAKQAALRVERFCKSSGGTLSEAEEAINTLEHECVVLKAALTVHPLATESMRDDSH